MRKLLIGCSVTSFLVMPPTLQIEGSVFPQAQAQTRDALILKCRKAVFRKYGRRVTHVGGSRMLELHKDFVVRQVDMCVANGGRVS